MKQNQTKPSVAVLMCTYQGERFLEEQLDSIFRQQGVVIQLWISDDGSTDATLNILQEYKKNSDIELTVISGPQQGFAKNFLSLTCRSEIKADYYAYSDQDDIWEPDKLSRAITLIKNEPESKPVLYCSRTKLINEAGQELGLSPLFKKPPCFANALVQNIGGGNTMVMNNPAHGLLLKVGVLEVVSHDWWTYMLISGAGGIVIYDSVPYVQYRQHDDNFLGSNMSWGSRLSRIKMLLKDRYTEWNSLNTAALKDSWKLLSRSNQLTLEIFSTARERPVPGRLYGIWKSGIHRQTMFGNIALLVATLLNKL